MYRSIVNGKIVTETEIVAGSLIYDDNGKITAVIREGEDNPYRIERSMDAGGAYVVPGGVDAHVHLGGFGTIPIADDFYTGSKAALTGGTTTVVDFCEPERGENAVECIRKRKKQAEKSLVDYAFHYTFTENYKEELKILDQILEEGIGSFKAFTYYDNTSLKPGDFRVIMEKIKGKGTLLVHAEERSIIDCLREQCIDTGDDMYYLGLTRPSISEKLAVMNVLELAKEADIPICIAHTSTKETVLLKKAEEKPDFFLETCPHYLEFTDEKLRGKDGALYTMNPPLRKREDTEELWKAVLDGRIHVFSTDHCPYRKEYKYGTDYRTVPCGVDGIQTRMWYLLSEGVINRGLSIRDFVKMTSENPARMYGIFPQKGCIRSGSDADFAIVSLEGESAYSNSDIQGATDYSIYENKRFFGKIKTVIKAGRIVAEENKFLGCEEKGSYLEAAARQRG